MSWRVAIFSTASLVVACGGTAISEPVAPEAPGLYVIWCSVSLDPCHEEAKRICPRGYDLVDWHGENVEYATTSTMATPNGPVSTRGTSTEYHGKLYVQCK